jgi:hypothetical protein
MMAHPITFEDFEEAFRPKLMTPKEQTTMTEVTFKDFQKLMVKRRRTVDDLVDIFRGKLDDSRSFLERVMSCQWRNPDTGRFEDRSDVVIPYKSVIEFYLKEQHYLEDSKKRQMKVSDLGKTAIAARDFIEVFEQFSPYGYLPLNGAISGDLTGLKWKS